MCPHDDDIKPNTVEGPSATVEMCQYCFDIVIRDLSKHTPSNDSLASFMDGLSPTIECPLFVTWDLKDMSSPVDYTLRGCIGTLSPRPLATAIRDYALTSAFHDNRFEPVRLDEVPNLRVGVSLLVKYEECRDSLDWVVGVHGILIKFCANGMDYSATYLPEVAQQQRWTQEKAIKSLIHKSGYRGIVSIELLASIHCKRYQSSKCRLTYDEYLGLLNGVDPLSGSSALDKRLCIVT